MLPLLEPTEWNAAPAARLVTEPLGPEDTLRITGHFRALSPEDRTLRFGQPQTDDAWIAQHMHELDFTCHTLLGITAPNRTLVALLSIQRFRSGRRPCGDLLFSVHPAWRGCGLASRLMRLALGYARICGLTRLVASTAPGHDAMRAVLAAGGMQFVLEHGRWFGTLDVAPEGAPPAADPRDAAGGMRHSPACFTSSSSSRKFRPTRAIS
ncbi:MAG: GNAT family N-acetyltransferase [Burkholderiales bacterium]